MCSTFVRANLFLVRSTFPSRRCIYPGHSFPLSFFPSFFLSLSLSFVPLVFHRSSSLHRQNTGSSSLLHTTEFSRVSFSLSTFSFSLPAARTFHIYTHRADVHAANTVHTFISKTIFSPFPNGHCGTDQWNCVVSRRNAHVCIADKRIRGPATRKRATTQNKTRPCIHAPVTSHSLHIYICTHTRAEEFLFLLPLLDAARMMHYIVTRFFLLPSVSFSFFLSSSSSRSVL